MEIELYFADQLVPQGELFRAVQHGTLDAVQSDDDSMGSPADVAVFGGYFPFATRYTLDVPALFHRLRPERDLGGGLCRDRRAPGSAPAPGTRCNFATNEPIRSLADLKGKRVFTVPTAGRFLTQFGVVPVTLPWEDIEVAMQTGELDGIAWCGITELHAVGWSKVCNYYLTNNITGAWIGSLLRQHRALERAAAAPADAVPPGDGQLALLPPALVLGGRGALPHRRRQARADHDPRRGMGRRSRPRPRSSGTRSPPSGERPARVVQILKDYRAIMQQAGPPYRYA